jgi:hypothetical protein
MPRCPVVSVGTKGIAVAAQGPKSIEVPEKAWRAANAAYESPEWTADRDELSAALHAAAPHIIISELDDLIRKLGLRSGQIPLLGRRNNGMRDAVEEVIQLLESRRSDLEDTPPCTPPREPATPR